MVIEFGQNLPGLARQRRTVSVTADAALISSLFCLEVGMGNKFEPGEIAIFNRADWQHMHPDSPFSNGMEITIRCLATPSELFGYNIYPGDHYHIEGYSWALHEDLLRKRPQPGDYKSTLVPCDKQFPAVLDRWLNPVPAELEARIARIFPSLDELNKRREVYEELYRVGRKRYTPNWLRGVFDD